MFLHDRVPLVDPPSKLWVLILQCEFAKQAEFLYIGGVTCSCDDLDKFGLDSKCFEGFFPIFLSQFRQIMETQFLSFNASVNVTNFEALSACIFSWLEEYCKPQVSGLEYHTLLRTAFTELRVLSYVEKMLSCSMVGADTIAAMT